MCASMKASGWAILVLAAVLGCAAASGQEPAGPPLHIGGNVKPPSVVFSDEPRLSDGDAKLYRQSGQVYLWVDEKGLPSHVRIVRSTGVARIDSAFVAAVKRYRFKPATMDGKPVTVDLYIEVNISTF